MQVFKIEIVGDTDSNKDGSPDVTAKVEFFGAEVLSIKQDLNPVEAFGMFGTLFGVIRKAFGLK